MQITLSNEITVQNPTPEVIKLCTDNLVIQNPEYYKKQRMGFWIGNTPATLSLYKKKGCTIVEDAARQAGPSQMSLFKFAV